MFPFLEIVVAFIVVGQGEERLDVSFSFDAFPFFKSCSPSSELASQDIEHDYAYQNPDGQDIGDDVERGLGRRGKQENEDSR